MSGYMFHEQQVEKMLNDVKVPSANLYSFEAVMAFKAAERETVVDQVLEIMDLNKFCKYNDTEQAQEWNQWLDELRSDILALKGVQIK